MDPEFNANNSTETLEFGIGAGALSVSPVVSSLKAASPYSTYNIVLNPGADKTEFLHTLTVDTTANASVNNSIPNNAIGMTTENKAPWSNRILSVPLTESESIAIKDHPDVASVEGELEDIDETWLDAQKLMLQRSATGSYRGKTANTLLDNWGLWRHSTNSGNNENINDWSSSTDSTVRTNIFFQNTHSAGWGADVIIQEMELMQWKHDEFLDYSANVDVVPTNLEGYHNAHSDQVWRPEGHHLYSKTRFVKFQWNKLPNMGDLQTVNYDLIPKNGMPEKNEAGEWASYIHENAYHPTLCGSIAAGNKYGWAKQSRVYFLPMGEDSVIGGVKSDRYFSAIKAFHEWKIAQVAAGNMDYAVPPGPGFNGAAGPRVVRPTIVNASWSQTAYVNGITSVRFRGNTFTHVSDLAKNANDYPTLLHSNDLLSRVTPPIKKFGISPTLTEGKENSGSGLQKVNNPSSEAYRTALQEMQEAGVHYVKSAGNKRQKLDIPGGIDYDNYLTSTYSGGQPIYYSRGSSNMANDTIVVGNIYDPIDAVEYGTPHGAPPSYVDGETGAQSSDRGPRVDIFAAGSRIYGADIGGPGWSTKYNRNGSIDRGNSQYNSGTSFSAPQITGMVAVLAARHPNTTPGMMRRFVRGNSAFHSSNNVWDVQTVANNGGGQANVSGDFHHFGNTYGLYGCSGNIAFLDYGNLGRERFLMSNTIAYNYEFLDGKTSHGGYINYTDHVPLAVSDPLAAGSGRSTFDLTGLPTPRFGTNKGYRFYKFVGYDDFARTKRATTYSEVPRIDLFDKEGWPLFNGQMARHSSDQQVVVDAGFAGNGYMYTSRSIFYNWELNGAGATYSVNVGGDTFKNSPHLTGLSGSGYEFMVPAVFDDNVSGRYYPEFRAGWNNHGDGDVGTANVEFTVDFGRTVFLANARFSTSGSQTGSCARYMDIYGSQTPFTEEGAGPAHWTKQDAVQIGEINRGDIIACNYGQADSGGNLPFGGPTQPGQGHNGNAAAPRHRMPANGYIEGILDTDPGVDPPIVYGEWDPEASPSGWYLIPPENYEGLVTLGKTFAGNAVIANSATLF
jgi:hypothetical protein